MSLQIRKLSHALGAEIIGMDLREPLDDTRFNEIHRAFLEYSVLLFRGQSLTREQHLGVSRRFGELDNNDLAPRDRDSEYPEILFNTNKPKAGGKPAYGAIVWHSDRAFMCTPAMATLLRAVKIPDVGGDTMFSNTYLAYETLSDTMKKLIDALYGVHPGGKRIIDDSTPERLVETKRLSLPVAHPLVRVHPETGRKALYVTEKVSHVVGMTTEESKPLIQFLLKHATRPQFVYRHQWQQDDLLIWDNRCSLHIAVNDYDKTQLRHLEKTMVIGTPSGYVYEGSLQ